ncbi:hypothetical protein LBMAG42_37630 [Deltaproteobacteria bacterium]|nr:hypothetical protein LBMAG42_37630 [Deltaproteobacteria bacterium]
MILLVAACGFVTIDDGDSTNDPADTSDTASTTDANYCDDGQDTSAPRGPDCYSGTLTCGETVELTTEGGQADFQAADFTSNFCFTNNGSATYGGSERVFLVTLEADVYAVASLSADCASMGLAAMRWTDGTTCPIDQSVPECEGKEGNGALAVTFGGYPASNQWALVVDTSGDEPAAFRLSLACE